MGRRRRKEGLAEVLITMPWQVSAAIAVGGFALLRWGIPTLFVRNPFLVGIAGLSQSFAWVPMLVFGLISVLAFFNAKTASSSSNKTSKYSVPKGDIAVLRPAPKGERNGSNGSTFNEPQVVSTSEINRAPTAWSLAALRMLEWKRFELLCAKYYETVGFKSETIRCGADGGIDVKLFRVDPKKPLAVVQCKAWNTAVGVKEIRELMGVMAHEKVSRGIFITTSGYTKDALEFGATNPIQLLDGTGFVSKLTDLPKEVQDSLLRFAFEGDYQTPTCPSCGIKLTKRDGKRGAFWGCVNYPRCKSTLPIRAHAGAGAY